MEIKYKYKYDSTANDNDSLVNHIGTVIWICCYNANRMTFPQKVMVDSVNWVKLFDKKGNVSKKKLAIHGVGSYGNILQMFTDKQECIDRWTELNTRVIDNIKRSIIEYESDIIKHENLIIEANNL